MPVVPACLTRKTYTIHSTRGSRHPERPLRFRYLLTDKGRDLYPVLSAIIDWGNRFIPGTLSRKQIEAQLHRSRSG